MDHSFDLLSLDDLLAILCRKSSEQYPFESLLRAFTVISTVMPTSGISSPSHDGTAIARSTLRTALLTAFDTSNVHDATLTPRLRCCLIDDVELLARLQSPWMHSLRDQAVAPLGGLTSIFLSPQLEIFDQQRQRWRAEHRISSAILEYVVKGIAEDACLVGTLEQVAYSMKEDVLGYGASYYKAVSHKRSAKADLREYETRVIGLSRAKFFTTLRLLNPNSGLAYFLEDFVQNALRIIGADPAGAFFSNSAIAQLWTNDTILQDRLYLTLSGYEFIRRRLLSSAPQLGMARAWPAASIETAESTAVPRFTDQQDMDAFGHLL